MLPGRTATASMKPWRLRKTLTAGARFDPCQSLSPTPAFLQALEGDRRCWRVSCDVGVQASFPGVRYEVVGEELFFFWLVGMVI